jgi:hypothetical protein
MMATEDQKQELFDALKFTPRDITIATWGYGGEIVMGRITAQQYNFWQGREDFSDYVWDWDYEVPDHAPPGVDFIDQGSWYDCDDIAHENSVEMSDSCGITVTDNITGEVIWESRLGVGTLQDHGAEVEWTSCIERADFPGEYLFIGQSIEKGQFWDGTVRITQPFDPSRLSFRVVEVDGWSLFGGLTYDGQDPEDLGNYDTTGKGSEFSLHYEPDMDNDFSDWHDAATTHPAHDGVYDTKNNQSEPRRAWWVNDAWRDQSGTEIVDVQSWRGLKNSSTDPH